MLILQFLSAQLAVLGFSSLKSLRKENFDEKENISSMDKRCFETFSGNFDPFFIFGYCIAKQEAYHRAKKAHYFFLLISFIIYLLCVRFVLSRKVSHATIQIAVTGEAVKVKHRVSVTSLTLTYGSYSFSSQLALCIS